MAIEKITFEISWETIFKIAFLTISLYCLYQIQSILMWTIFSIVISLLFNPVIDFLQKKGVPRALSVIFIYFSIFGILSLLVYLLSPLLAMEVYSFSQTFSEYFDKISPFLRSFGIEAFESLDSFVAFFRETLSSISKNVFSALFSLFGGIFSTIFVISLAAFLSLEEKSIEKGLLLFFPKNQEDFVLNLWQRCEKKVSGWFLSRVAGSLFVGVLTYIALLLFNSQYPFSLAFLATVLNFIPFVGPIVTAGVIFFTLSLENLLRAVFSLVVFTLIQQIENNILTPVLSKKFIGLSPALVLISLAIGGTLGGTWGAILGIPLMGILFEFLRDFLKKKKETETTE